MTLQLVHTENRPVRASSLYCHWILTPGENGKLRAVWIDREMRAFEEQMANETGALVDEPGGSGRHRSACGEAGMVELYELD